MYCFIMSRCIGADFLVGWELFVTACITGHYFNHSRELLKGSHHTPEAAARKGCQLQRLFFAFFIGHHRFTPALFINLNNGDLIDILYKATVGERVDLRHLDQ